MNNYAPFGRNLNLALEAERNALKGTPEDFEQQFFLWGKAQVASLQQMSQPLSLISIVSKGEALANQRTSVRTLKS